MPGIYIDRQIRLGDETLSEAGLLSRARLIVVLAEPGAGKTELLTKLAFLLGTERLRASRFRNMSAWESNRALVIDAMDEVAKLGGSELNDIVAKASESGASAVIFASRSGEWEGARTRYVETCFRTEPTIIHLKPFDREEQRLLFENLFPNEDFASFEREADNFDLAALLGNPEFLQLFARAYIANGGRFTSKAQIYSDAAKHLALEQNQERSMRKLPSSDVIAHRASSVFARLLLSGASGVSLREKIDQRDFPFVGVVDGDVPDGILPLLDTKLFKPSDGADEHEPIHRIVAEYLGGRYLAERLSAPADSLSIARCLAVIAPNGVVRDELRGMLGWMAALGGDAVQKAALAVDPYAVLSNGDPALLSSSNRLLLINRLKEVSKTDPYFRRGDIWRSFNVGQFFSDETVGALSPILNSRDQSHLRKLILELIDGTSVVLRLSGELETLALDPGAEDYERINAHRLLLSLEGFDGVAAFDTLVSEASFASLYMATDFISSRGTDALTFDQVLGLLQALETLYPRVRDRRNQSSRFFLREFFNKFPAHNIPQYLEALALHLDCTCGDEHSYNCACRHGRSRIVSGLLDRLVGANPEALGARAIWRWTKDLRFNRRIGQEDSALSRLLSEDDALRQAVQAEAFTGLDAEEIKEVQRTFFHSQTHTGLTFKSQDLAIAAQQAFDNDNLPLWESFYRQHNFYRDEFQADPLRALLRRHANEKSEFGRIWARREHDAHIFWRQNRRHWSPRRNRHAEKQRQQEARTLSHFLGNLDKIRAGRHWWWLQQFAYYYLHGGDELSFLKDHEDTVREALRNCFPFLRDHTPSVVDLANRRGGNIAEVLHAAALLNWRKVGSLSDLSRVTLRAVKVESGVSKNLTSDEWRKYDAEIDRCIFLGADDAEQFLRDYIEPSLLQGEESFSHVEWLISKQAFAHLRASLALEWLRRFPDMPQHAETVLFGLAAAHASPTDLRTIIADRVEYYLRPENVFGSPGRQQRKTFWLLNSLFHDDDESIWGELQTDRNVLLAIAGRNDRFFGGGPDAVSPPLSASKLLRILDSFIDQWPAVELPGSHGSDSPDEEKAYRYLREMPWRIAQDIPEQAFPALDTVMSDTRFARFANDALAAKASVLRKRALDRFEAPSPSEIAGLLEKRTLASVEDIRAFMVEALADAEIRIRNSDTNTLDTFYPSGMRVDENAARNRIVDNLRPYLTAQGLSDSIEFHMVDGNRCDIACSAVTGGRRRLLVIEVKGQWHDELFSAAAEQLDARYTGHPDAEKQGIYLVLWFGTDVEVAGRTNSYNSPHELRERIVSLMPAELNGRIDVKMIDLSRKSEGTPKMATAGRARKR